VYLSPIRGQGCVNGLLSQCGHWTSLYPLLWGQESCQRYGQCNGQGWKVAFSRGRHQRHVISIISTSVSFLVKQYRVELLKTGRFQSHWNPDVTWVTKMQYPYNEHRLHACAGFSCSAPPTPHTHTHTPHTPTIQWSFPYLPKALRRSTSLFYFFSGFVSMESVMDRKTRVADSG
jgi:hypothetical protein